MKNLYNKNSKYAFSFFFGFIAIISISNEMVAQVRVPFTQRTSAYSPNKKIYNVKGDFTMVGNTNLTLQNYGNSIGNENSMVYVDSDTDSNTWNSSSSTLGFSTENGAIPNCSNIIYAGLYWTGRTSDSNPSSTTFSVTKNMPIVSTINNDLNVGNGIAIANTSYVLTISRGGSANNRYPIYTFTSGSNTYVFNYTNAAPITLSVNGGTATNIPVSIVTNGLTETATFTTPYIITDGLIGLSINSLVRSTDTNLNPANTQNTSFANVNVSGTVPTTTTVTKNFDKRKILLKGPRATSYTQFTANDSDIYYPTTTGGFMYSAYKEVTDYVRTNGIGEYFTADMALVEGNGGGTGFYGGWGLIVVYENSKMKYRDVTIFDGHAYVAAGITNYELPVSGFNSGQAGPIGMKIGVISGEGDVGITGDYFQIQKQSDATFLSLNHSGNTTTNFFNSSIQTGGNARNPSLLNNTGLDISMFSIPNVNNTVITNNQTSTKFKYGTTGDTYIIFAIAMAIDAYIPEPEIISSVTSINGISVSGTGPFTVLPGQEVEYKLKVYNKGTEPLNSTKITIPISNTASIVAGSAINTIYFNPFPTPNNVYFDPLISANGSLIWNIGTLPLPVSPTILLGELTFKVKVTENCTILKNTNCLPNLTLYGSLSGIGAITNIALNEKPFIQGYTDSGICQGEPIKSPLTINIDSRNFINQNCSAAPSEINFSFCSGENAIPISQINSGFAPGTRFYNSYPINANSIEYTSSNPFPNNATTTTYYAIPPGLADCYFTFKISAFTTPVFTILNNYIINACNNTANISRLSYSETPISITLAEFIENGGTTSNELLNYSISYVDLKSGNCPINIIRTFTVSSACGVQNLIQHISIIDTTLPTASNPNSITILGCNGTFPSPNISLVADALDNCSTPNVTFVNDSLPTISGCTETTIRTYKVTDACGNFITVSQNLIRTIDTTLPTASNPTNISILGCNGTFPSPAVSVVTDASDNCSTPLVSFVNDSLPTISGCTETNIRTYKVTDVCGNFINVTQNLIRTIDTTLPTASNPANIAISGCNGTFSAPNISVVADASDNCSTPNVSFVNDSLPTVSGCTETTVRTYKVTDACGNFITVSQNLIRTIDSVLPTASNPTDITISGCNGTFENPNSAVVTDASDNCSTPIVSFVNDSVPNISGCTETTIRTYKVTDACENFITVTQNLIRTIDTTLPTASNPANISILGCNGTFPSPAVSVVADASDNCSTPNVSFVNDSAPTVSGCTETTIRTYKVADACGNFINVTQNLIRTIDTTLPTASNPANISILGCNGTFPSPAVSAVTNALDNCSTPLVSFVNDSLPTISGCTETTVRTYKVTDACGNFITVTQNLIRTIDTTLPTASNPANISILGCNGTFPSPAVSVVADASDNCSTPIISFVNDSLPIVSGCTETTVRTYKVTDTCGNFINVTQNLIRTIDTTLPTASNPANISILGCNGTFPNPAVSVVADASDNCSAPNVTFVNDSLPTISGCTETTIRTYKVADACGNFINVTQNLIRTIDSTLPTASNPANISILGCNGTFPSPAVSVVADASDNCSTPLVSFVNDSLPTVSGCTETTVRTYKVTDACGNFITVSQNLIRTIDSMLPTASNPNSIAISGCNGTFDNPNSAVVTDASDNCSTTNVSFVNDSLPIISGCTETTVRTYKVTDACGNFITVSQNLIRTIDTTLPTASNPANISISGCNGTFSEPNISVVTDASDNCSTPNVTFVNDSLPTISGCTETTIRTYKVTDACGNFINVTQNLIRTIDTTLPTASNPANISILGCNGTFPSPAVSVVADASDNCSTPNVTFVNDSLPTVSGCIETTIRTYKVTDACGNFITVTQNLIRTIDTTLPTASNPNPIVILGCNGTFPNADISVVADAFDNCSIPNVTFVNDSLPTVSGCIETTIRTYKVTDACGNFINVTQNLIRTIDTTLPTASNPNPIAISGCNGTFSEPNILVVTDASDNCSTPLVSFVNDSLPTISGCTETTVRTYKVTDACGNFITISQNLIRTIDTTLPTASNPNPIEISGCNGTFSEPNSAVVTDASDNCSTTNVSFVNDSLPIISGCTETTVRTYKVTDACGNFITVSQNLIRTIDTTLPTASNPNPIEISSCNGTFSEPNISVVTDASDNCSTPNVTFVNDSLPTISGCTETTFRTYKVTDACGNFITVTQNLIRTIDTTLPTASNPANISILGCNGTFPNPAVLVVADASDNCSTPLVSFVNDSLPTVSGCTETTVRTYKVTDACGNFITVSQNLIRTIDSMLPTASNPNSIAISGCNGTFDNPNSAVVTDASDNCSTTNVSFVNDSLPIISGCTETTVRTYKVTDACGNFITVSQNLIRTIDTTLPTASNPANISISGCNGTFSEPNISVVTDALDNCSTPVVSFVNDSAPTISGCTETTVRTYKVTNACGNFINVTQNLIRTIDMTLPTASNPNSIAISGCNGTFPSPAVSVVTDASDNCSIPLVSFVNDSLPTISGCTETTIRTYKVTDACGNFITVTQNLIRTIDTTLPTASNPANISILGCNGTFSEPNIADVTDALDNCSIPLVSFVNDSLPTVSGCTETTVRTYKVTDACGNFINVTQNLIRTIDMTLPTASNPNSIAILGCNGTFPSPAVSVVADASDNCSIPLVSFVNDSLPTVSGCTETTIRTYKVTDACGNFITVTQNLIRTIDTTLPTASNPNPIAILGCNGTFSAPNISVVTDASDNCSTPNVTFVNDSLPTVSGCIETTVRTYKVTDACGNFIIVSQNLIRTIDTTLPTASNPANIAILGCNGTFPSPAVSVVADASDNCSTPNVTFVNDSLPTVSGCTETTVRTYKVTDACGNFVNVTQNLIRTIDTTAPTFTSPIPINISASCNAIPVLPIITAEDNCGTTNITLIETRVNGSCNSSYVLKRTWTASDSCGNSKSVSQEISVSDTEAPTIAGPFDAILNVNCDRIPATPILQFIDNCSGVGTIILPSADVQINQTSSSYSIIRAWNVSDLCGNSYIFTQTINVTIQDSFTVLQEQACNGDASVINLNNLIPINSVGLGTWTDSNTGMAITNGIFTPLGVLLGEHSFEYKISDLFCPRKIQILMNVNDDCLVLACGNIVVHNAFSPNNDGLNEIFTIENLENKTCYPTNKVAIYNRWGVLIYETEGYNNNDIAFKGISEGKTTIKKSDELPSGTYYYILNFTDDQGKKHNKDGYLYLSR